MFSRRKRFIAIAVAAVLPIFAALWSAFLSKLTSGQGDFYRYLPYIYVAVISSGSAATAYYTHFRPSRDLEKPVLLFLGVLAADLLKTSKRLGIGPRINLMVVRRPWYFLGKTRLAIAWGVNMESFPDVRFSCRSDQGVSGQALKTKRPVLFDCDIVDKSAFHFTQKQLEQTAHVKAVWSWPIYQIDAKGQQTGAVVGVLNLDATMPGSFNKLQSQMVSLEKAMENFAEIASTII